MNEKVPPQNFTRLVLLLCGLTIFYGLIFCIYTYPLVLNFSNGFPGFDTGFSDANQYVWNIYNFKKAVSEGSSPLFTDLLLYPKGSSLLFHTYTPVLGILGLLFTDPVLAVNVGLLLSFILSGIGAFFLSRRLIPNSLLALLTGLIFAFSPYKMAHLLEHYHLMLTATIPFFILFFLRAFAFETGKFWPRVLSWKAVFICLGLGLVTFLSDYYALFFLLYFCGAYALYFLLKLGNINWRKPKTWLISGAILLAAPLLVPLLKKWGLDDKGGLWWGGDVAGYLLAPNNNRWLSNAFTQKMYSTESVFNTLNSVENVVFLGYTLLVLTALIFFWRKKYKADTSIKPFIFLAIFFWLVTMPEFSVFGKVWFRTPTALLHFIPFFNNIRCPTRAVVMLTLFLPIVCFYFLNQWLKFRDRKWQLAVPLVLLIFIFLEYQPKAYPLITKSNIPKAYREVAKAKGEVAFIFPFGIRDGFQEKGKMVLNDLFYQTQHHKKMPGAYISRIPQQEFDEFDQHPVMDAFMQMETDSTFLPGNPTVSEKASFFKIYQPAVFLVTPHSRNPHLPAYLENLLQGQPFRSQEMNSYKIWINNN